MNRLNYAIATAGIMAVLAFVLGGWLVKAALALGSVTCWAIYAYHHRLWGLSLYLIAVLGLHLCADVLTFADMSVGAIISYAIFCVTLGGCITLARRGSKMLQVFTVLTNTVFIVLPTFYITHYVVFSAGVTRDVYHGMLQTNLAEAIEFTRTTGIAEHLPVPVFCIILLTLLLCLYLRKTKLIQANTKKVFVLLTLVAATGWSGTSKRAPDTGPRVTRDLGLYTIKYYNRLRLFKRRTAKRDISDVQYTASKSGKSETYVIVIGESLNRHHMQIYGYPRRTTPRLAAEKSLLFFHNVYSTHIQTAHALVKAFTTATQYNGREWYQSVSIIDILKKTKTKTFWISNQNLFSFFIDAITLFAQNTDHHFHVGDAFYDTPHYDEVLLPHIERVLANNVHDNRVIFVHLMGNHADYCLRYPPAYTRYHGSLDASVYGSLAQTQVSHQQQINCYDNSVLYNDFIVGDILSMLKKRTGVNGFIYFSDHAVDLLADKVKIMHSFSHEMTSIPLLMWFSPAYREQYPHVYQNLQNNRHQLFSGDLLYDTLLGVMAIASNQYNPRADLSSSVYELKDNEALALNGKRRYQDNIYWQQRKHLTALVAEGQDNRAIPAQINNLGKLREAWHDGSRAFAVDLRHTDTCLAVGNSGMCLLDFLSHVDASQIKKLWLKISNLHVPGLSVELSKIKSLLPAAQTIVDIPCFDNFKSFELSGWQQSCVLSSGQWQGLAAETATSLAEQLNNQNVTAISLAADLYPRVTKHLAPLLPAVVFHLTSSADVVELQNTDYWSNPRVETVAFRYHSRFQLPVKTPQKKYAVKRLSPP